MLLFVIAFEIGMGPIPWLLIAEIFPSEQRGAAMSLATLCNWMSNFAIGLVFPVMAEKMGPLAWLPFAVGCVVTYLGVAEYCMGTEVDDPRTN